MEQGDVIMRFTGTVLETSNNTPPLYSLQHSTRTELGSTSNSRIVPTNLTFVLMTLNLNILQIKTLYQHPSDVLSQNQFDLSDKADRETPTAPFHMTRSFDTEFLKIELVTIIFLFLITMNEQQVMPSMSRSHFDIHHNSTSSKLPSMKKETVLKCCAGVIIGLTFVLCCLALGLVKH